MTRHITSSVLITLLSLAACRPDDTSDTDMPVSPTTLDMSVDAADLDPPDDMTYTDAQDADVSDMAGDEELDATVDMRIDPPAPARPVGVANSTSFMGHFNTHRTASVELPGPKTSQELTVQTGDFKMLTGEDVGTSPWHVFSEKQYATSTSARTIWGASLKYVYKFVVDGSDFVFADLFELNAATTSIPWNLVALDQGRFLVPDGDGYRQDEQSPCYGTQAAMLIFEDDKRDPYSPITCTKKFELDPAALRTLCQASGRMLPGSGNSTSVMWTGEIATNVTFEQAQTRTSYMVVLDNALDEALACAPIDDSQISNEAPIERLSETQSAVYYASETGIIKMVYDASSKSVERRWERSLDLRARTGTTPTLVDTSDGEQLVVLVDAPCATSNILNGLITCSDDRPAKLVALRRADELGDKPERLEAELPGFIRTVENSPAAHGDTVVIANYSGYLPNGLIVPAGGQPPEGGVIAWGTSPDSEPDFAQGVVAMKWDPDTSDFELFWAQDQVQFSGVPTINAGANMVYGTGADQDDQKTYVYGLYLEDEEDNTAGELAWHLPIGDAPFRETTTNAEGDVVIRFTDYSLESGEVFDAGNNLLVNDDGSLFMAGGSALIRVYDTSR